MTERIPFDVRFWAKVDKHGPVPDCRPDLGPCWLWTAYCTPEGYGRLARGHSESPVLAYKWAWEQEHGPVPPGLTLDHLCRVRRCVRPPHMEPVTIRENLMRGDTLMAANLAKTHCLRGHEYTPDNIMRPAAHPTWRVCRACFGPGGLMR